MTQTAKKLVKALLKEDGYEITGKKLQHVADSLAIQWEGESCCKQEILNELRLAHGAKLLLPVQRNGSVHSFRTLLKSERLEREERRERSQRDRRRAQARRMKPKRRLPYAGQPRVGV